MPHWQSQLYEDGVIAKACTGLHLVEGLWTVAGGTAARPKMLRAGFAVGTPKMRGYEIWRRTASFALEINSPCVDLVAAYGARCGLRQVRSRETLWPQSGPTGVRR
jgi:hypothetical protein